jgi:hypothetical protein
MIFLLGYLYLTTHACIAMYWFAAPQFNTRHELPVLHNIASSQQQFIRLYSFKRYHYWINYTRKWIGNNVLIIFKLFVVMLIVPVMISYSVLNSSCYKPLNLKCLPLILISQLILIMVSSIILINRTKPAKYGLILNVIKCCSMFNVFVDGLDHNMPCLKLH